MDPSPLIGRTLGDFLLTEKLGAGGAGEVFRAEQVTLGREAVIKVMGSLHGGTHSSGKDESTKKSGGESGSGSSKGSTSGEASKRFLREARLASQLDHPFAAHIYGFGVETDGTLWIAMELVRGSSLDALIKEQGTIALVRFAPFFDRLCEVLHAMHEQGIIHRDIKPHNVMVLSRAGRLLPKLLDLGIARRSGEGTDKNVQLAGSLLTTQTLSSQLVESETMSLTMQGNVVGTPHYLPPEQWRNASHADARSDIYSLAILAYQALTGKLPFAAKGNSLFALAAAHARDPLPPLPENLPPALYEVLSKGAAKKPADRYVTVLEFASAMRAASGVGVEPLALPQLEKALIDTLVSDAPQPIAEATTLLEGARTPKQQLDAVVMTYRVVGRYLAVLALACRGRVGPGGPRDSDAVVALLEKLAVDKLSDDEWVSLARELGRPFAFRKNAHPLPELISFFFLGETDAQPGHGEEAVRTLLATGWPEAGANDEVIHGALLKLVPAIGLVLQRLSFMFDYALVVRHEESERWMGTRRIRRVTQDLAAQTAPAPPQGLPFLVDRVGLPVMTLSPLMQVISPSGGMPEELFFLDGAGRNGARMVALPGPYERQSEDVWAWLSANVVDVTRSQAAKIDAEKPPYKGLSTFTADDADNYFGREREAESFANRLRTSRLLAVVGPSGTGKSSFILAGVLPLLPAGWRAVVSRPGANPFAALNAKLSAAGFTDVTPATLGDGLVADLAEGESLLVVVDQFEELVTLCQDPALRLTFAEALVAAAEHPSGRLRVVLTLRDDFLIKVQQLKPLRDRMSSSLQLLATPAEDDLMRVVTEPARRVGYTFDDAELPREMVRAVAEYPGALALLSFTASQMWELRDRQLRQMRAKTYEALGGVGGALAHHAEVTLAQMSEEEQKLVREAFRHLVTSQGTRAVLSRKEMLEVLGGSAAAQSVVHKLTDARLLVTSETAEGDDRIEIIHEALIVAWPRLVAWQREDAETARLRDSLRASARQWVDRGKPRGLLWRAETLNEYKVWRARYPGRLTESEDQFATASLRDEARGRRIRQGLSITAFVVLAIGLVVIFRAYREAQHRFLAMREEQGRLALLDEKPLEALAYLSDAVTGGANTSSLRHMAGIVDFELQGAKGVLTRHSQAASAMQLSPDGLLVASIAADQMLGLASVDDASVRALVALGAVGLALDFSPDGRKVVVLCADQKARVVDVASKSVTSTFDIGAARPLSVAVAAKGTDALLSQGNLGVRRLNLTSGLLSVVYTNADAAETIVKLSPDRSSAVIFGGTGVHSPGSISGLFILNETSRALVRVDLPVRVRTASWVSDGSRVAVGTIAGDVGVWDVRASRWSWFKNQTKQSVRSVVFSKDGKHVGSASADYVIQWGEAGAVEWLATVKEPIAQICWAADSSQLFAGGLDPSLHAFDAVDGHTSWRHFGHTAQLLQCEGTASGAVVSVAVDGSVRAWDGRIHRDETIAGSASWLNFAAPNDDSPPIVLTEKGVWTLGSDHGLTLLHAGRPPDAGVVVGGNSYALITNELQLFDRANGTLRFSTTIPKDTRAFALGGVDSVAAVTADNQLYVRTANKPEWAPTATEDQLTSASFLDDHTVVTCSIGGLLRVFDTQGALLAKEIAHHTSCLVSTDAGKIKTWGGEDSVATSWQWHEGKLQLEWKVKLPGNPVALGPGMPLTFIGSTGDWFMIGDDNVPLAHVALRTGGLQGVSATGSAINLIDRVNRVSFFRAPPDAVPGSLTFLQKCRGVYTLQTGRLVLKDKQECEE